MKHEQKLVINTNWCTMPDVVAREFEYLLPHVSQANGTKGKVSIVKTMTQNDIRMWFAKLKESNGQESLYVPVYWLQPVQDYHFYGGQTYKLSQLEPPTIPQLETEDVNEQQNQSLKIQENKNDNEKTENENQNEHNDGDNDSDVDDDNDNEHESLCNDKNDETNDNDENDESNGLSQNDGANDGDGDSESASSDNNDGSIASNPKTWRGMLVPDDTVEHLQEIKQLLKNVSKNETPIKVKCENVKNIIEENGGIIEVNEDTLEIVHNKVFNQRQFDKNGMNFQVK